MAENTKPQADKERPLPVLLTTAEAPISEISRWEELDDGIGVCRITVMGVAPGPASSPPRITFYVKDGGLPEEGAPLRADEARRCVDGLRAGDVVRLAGRVGPERAKARRQEVIVTEEVRLRWRPERIVCRFGTNVNPRCLHGAESASIYGEVGMRWERSYDGESIICPGCMEDAQFAYPEWEDLDPAYLARGRGPVGDRVEAAS